MPDTDGFLFEIDGIPFQTHNLAAAQTAGIHQFKKGLVPRGKMFAVGGGV